MPEYSEPFNINGIIESYKVAAGENISAGDFVSWLTGDVDYGTDTKLSSTAQMATYEMSAVALSDDKVFIAHAEGSSGYCYLYGTLCTVSGTTITINVSKQLSSTRETGNDVSAVALSENKVFISHRYSTSQHAYGIVCTISGTAITAGTDTALSATSQAGQATCAVALSENKVFVAHAYDSSNRYLYGVVCTIDGTTITKGTDTKLSSLYYSAGNEIEIVRLNNNKVLIFHSAENSSLLYGIVCTINGTTITAGTDTRLSIGSQSGNAIGAVVLSENKVFIAHSNYESDVGLLCLYGMVCTISGTTITAGTDTKLSNYSNTGTKQESLSVIALSKDRVFIVYNMNGDYYFYSMICTISGTFITVEIETALSTTAKTAYNLDMVILSDGKALITHSYGTSYYLYGMVITYEAGITALSDTIFGIANQSGTGGDIIEVYVPN